MVKIQGFKQDVLFKRDVQKIMYYARLYWNICIIFLKKKTNIISVNSKLLCIVLLCL